MKGLWENLVKPLFSWVAGAISLSSQQALTLVLLALVLILAGGLSAIIYIFLNEPILVTTTAPYLSPKFPSEGLEQLIPRQKDGKLVVLSQRAVVDIDHWRVADNEAELEHCRPSNDQMSPCDEAHVYTSWTVIVPKDNKAISGTSAASTGSIGDIVALTPHSVNFGTPQGGRVSWWISNYQEAPGKVDVVIIRRDFYGGFQPVPRQKLQDSEPPLSQCEEQATAIPIADPTARAELILHTPQNMPLNLSGWRLWRRKSNWGPEEITQAQGRNGQIRVMEHNIHWRIGSSLLRDADDERIVYIVSWRWKYPITKGPVCSPTPVPK